VQVDIASILKNLPLQLCKKLKFFAALLLRYDASSSGGIVNVVLKKGVRIGLSGSVNLGANQGKYGNQFVGLNVNQGANTLSYYVNANYNRRDALEELNSDRFFTLDSSLTQAALTRNKANQYYFGYGINCVYTPKLEFGYDGG
jgi:iron complex outermembrane receptor protein